MPSQIVPPYKGFELSASLTYGAQSFGAEVCITRHNGPDVTQAKLSLPGAYKTEQEALDAGIAHGKAAIDGNVKGFDPAKMY